MKKNGRPKTNEKLNKEIGGRIRAVREAAGLTKGTVSRGLPINASVLGKIEAGRFNPTASTLLRLADFFECSIDLLVRGSAEVDDTRGRRDESRDAPPETRN